MTPAVYIQKKNWK